LFWLLALFWVGIGGSILAANVKHGPDLAGPGLLFVVPLLMFGLLTPQIWRPVRLTRDYLYVSRLVHDGPIPVSEIAGVGLCFQSRGRSSGWRTTVWTTDGGRFFVVAHMAIGRDGVARSKAAQQARELWQAVREIQGPTGPLTTRALQHTESAKWSTIKRVWCPDDSTLYSPSQRLPG
jgi:hypothetical protein